MIFSIIVKFTAVIMAIVIHEVAHGYIAFRLGDNTAKFYGRLSLNPVKHIDVFGSLLLPGILILSGTGIVFGWAKPVPVNFSNFTKPRRDIFLVSIAGVVANLICAVASALIIRLISIMPNSLILYGFSVFLINFMMFNLVLAAFNLLPIPPLDGSKILASLMHNGALDDYANNNNLGMIILFGLIFVLPYAGNLIGVNLNFLGMYVSIFTNTLMKVLI